MAFGRPNVTAPGATGNILGTDIPIGSSITSEARFVGEGWWLPVAVGNQFSLSSTPPPPLTLDILTVVNGSTEHAGALGVMGIGRSSDSDEAVVLVRRGELTQDNGELSYIAERWLDKGVMGGILGSG